ncbi:hypothetical protein DP56_6146 [Burkholderia pseudomallei]|nr:hypothetical protein DP56_6146 [Burkholderia pseudomallei]
MRIRGGSARGFRCWSGVKRDLQFTVHGSRFTVHGSRFDDCWLRVAVRVSCLVSRVLCFVLSPGVHRWVTCDARS